MTPSRHSYNLNTPYDVKSVMQDNGRACWLGYGYPDIIEDKRSDEIITGSYFDSISPIDQLEINRFYSCPDQDILNCKSGDDFVLMHHKCDGIQHCNDGSDEMDCQSSCSYQILVDNWPFLEKLYYVSPDLLTFVPATKVAFQG